MSVADTPWWLSAAPTVLAFLMAGFIRSRRKKPGSKGGSEKP